MEKWKCPICKKLMKQEEYHAHIKVEHCNGVCRPPKVILDGILYNHVGKCLSLVCNHGLLCIKDVKTKTR